jgi:predicted metal-dependent phosphoesterase TrpH
MRRIDLHAHTTHSDGSLTPAELVARAKTVGLVALAVTDHDTISGLDEAREAGVEHGVEILDGCEITARLPSGIAHVLAYAFERGPNPLTGLLERVCVGRHERNVAMLAKLAALDMPLDYDEVAAHAHGRIVARPHFAQAMVARGYVDDLREAFELYLRDGGPGYVCAEVPSAAEAIDATARSGGIPVLAHPRSLRMGHKRGYAVVLHELKEAGLIGLEVDHPSHDPTQRATFAELAATFDLVPTGGSDFHGAAKPHLALGEGDGTIEVTYETWERLLARKPAKAESD